MAALERYLLALMPIISLFAGLAMAPLAAVLAIMHTFRSPTIIRLAALHLFTTPYCFFFIFYLISCLWTIDPSYGLGTWLQITFTFLLGITYGYGLQRQSKSFLYRIVPLLFWISLTISGVEIILKGIITKYLWEIVGINKTFVLSELNRGMTVITLFLWPVLYSYLSHNKKGTSILLVSVTLLIAAFSDSLSALLALVAGYIAFIVSSYFPRYVKRYMQILLLLTAIAFPLLAAAISNDIIKEHLSFLPLSAQHRLYIWHYTSAKITEKIFIGYGLNASKFVAGTDISAFEGTALPLHPHNNFLQLWLEGGMVGIGIVLICLFTIVQRAYERVPMKGYPCLTGFIISAFTVCLISYGVWQVWWIATLLISGNVLLTMLQEKEH